MDTCATGPWPPAEVAETHCATVVFIGDRAYKIKKPVDLGFLDFSTPERRRQACEREIELNRRLAPDVYLGVADIIGPEGVACDHMVVMRRMPPERRLSTLIEKGEPVEDHLRGIARALAVLHASAPTSRTHPAIGEVATATAVLGNWRDNVAAMRPFAPPVLDREVLEDVWRLAERYLAGREHLLRQRIVDGLARDGHGDLLAQDIFCLDDGPRILDCLEFADRYRYGDVLLDAAFLVMDLHRLGRPAAADAFLRDYVEFSDEHHPSSLAHHYVAYRAGVRAKVACLRHEQGDPLAGEEARSLLALTRSQLQRSRVVLALVGGLPASGKSTIAAELAGEMGWALLSTDQIRSQLLPDASPAARSAGFERGIYTPQMRGAVYDEMMSRARALLRCGMSVVLDATWVDAAWRQAAETAARDTSSDLLELRCVVDEAAARARLADRTRASNSDATPGVRAAMAARTVPWPSAITVRTDGPVDESVAAATAAARRLLDTAVA